MGRVFGRAWPVLALLVAACAATESPYDSSGLPGDDLLVERAFANWPLQVSLAARIAAAPGLVVATQCDWELWRHAGLDAAGGHPLLCLSRHCGELRTQKAALARHRPAWVFHCLHAPDAFPETSPAAHEAAAKPPPASSNSSGGAAAAGNSSGSPGGAANASTAGGGQQQQQRDEGPKQVLSGMSNAQIEALIANATMLVVGVPSGAAACSCCLLVI